MICLLSLLEINLTSEASGRLVSVVLESAHNIDTCSAIFYSEGNIAVRRRGGNRIPYEEGGVLVLCKSKW